MTAVTMSERTHHGHFVSQFSQHWKMAAEGNAGQRSLHLAEHRPIFRRCRHFRVKGLYVRWPTLQVQHDDRSVLQKIVRLAFRCVRLERQRVQQGKTSQSKSSHAKKFTTRKAFAIGNRFT